MSLFSFFLGYISALVTLAAIVYYGSKYARKAVDKRLAELTAAHRSNRAVEAAANIEVQTVTSYVYLRATPMHSDGTLVPGMLLLNAGKLQVSVRKGTPPPAPSGHGGGNSSKDNEKERWVVPGSSSNDRVSLGETPVNRLYCQRDRDSHDRGLAFTTLDGTPMFTDAEDNSCFSLYVKFNTVRDAERWYNIFHPTPATREWSLGLGDPFQMKVANYDYNVLARRIFFENTRGAGAGLNEFIAKKIRKKLSEVKLPKPLDGYILLNRLDVGREVPTITSPSQLTVTNSKEIAFSFQLTYEGGFFLELCPHLELRGHPLPTLILGIRVQTLSARCHVSIGAPPSNKMWLGFKEPPVIALDIQKEAVTGNHPTSALLSTLVGAIPDMSEFVSKVVKEHLFEDMILPHMEDIPLPNVSDTPPGTPTGAGKPLPSGSLDGWDQSIPTPHGPKAGGTQGKETTPAAEAPPAVSLRKVAVDRDPSSRPPLEPVGHPPPPVRDASPDNDEFVMVTEADAYQRHSRAEDEKVALLGSHVEELLRKPPARESPPATATAPSVPPPKADNPITPAAGPVTRSSGGPSSGTATSASYREGTPPPTSTSSAAGWQYKPQSLAMQPQWGSKK